MLLAVSSRSTRRFGWREKIRLLWRCENRKQQRLASAECPLLAESSHSLTVNMQTRAYDRFWPKADIGAEFNSEILNDRFGEESGHSPFLTPALHINC